MADDTKPNPFLQPVAPKANPFLTPPTASKFEAPVPDHPVKAKAAAVNAAVKDASDTFHALRQSGPPGKSAAADVRATMDKMTGGGKPPSYELLKAAGNLVVDSLLGLGGGLAALGTGAAEATRPDGDVGAAMKVGMESVTSLNPLPPSKVLNKAFGAVQEVNQAAGETVAGAVGGKPGDKAQAVAGAATETAMNAVELWLTGKVMGAGGTLAKATVGPVKWGIPELGDKASVPAFQAKIDAFHDKLVAANAALQQAKPVEKPPAEQPVSAEPTAPAAAALRPEPKAAEKPPSKGGNVPMGSQTELEDTMFRNMLDSMGQEAGWAQEGGQLIRVPEYEGDPNPPVTGRTSWVPNAPWFADVQRAAPLPGNKGGKATKEAVRKALAGESLTKAEQRHVETMVGHVKDEIEAARAEGVEDYDNVAMAKALQDHAPALDLTAQTEASRMTEDAARRQAEGAAAATRIAAEDKTAADRERGDFTLTGSARPADIAMAGGQKDLLAAPTVEDAIDAAVVEKASALDEAAVERAAAQHENDDVAFMKAIRRIVDEKAPRQAPGGARQGLPGPQGTTLFANPFGPAAKAVGSLIQATGREMLDIAQTVLFQFTGRLDPMGKNIAKEVQEAAWAADSATQAHQAWLSVIDGKYTALGKQMGISVADLEQLHHYGEDAKIALTPNQRLLYDAVVRPMREMNDALVRERAKFDPTANDEVQYMPRQAKGKGTETGRRIKGLKEGQLTGIRTTAPSDIRRKYYDLEAVDGGERVVAKIGADPNTGMQRVTTFRKKVGEDIGPKDTTTLKELKSAVNEMQRQIDGMRAQIARGGGPKHLLERTLQGYKDSFASLKGSLTQAERAKLEPDERVLIDKNGRLWRQKQATTKRIEEHTTTQYYKYPVENLSIAIANNASALIYGKLLESIKNDPAVQKMGLLVKDVSEATDPHLRPINSPWFRGYRADPRIADILEDLTGREGTVAEFLRNATNFLIRPLFLVPIRHMWNVSNHYQVQRGFTQQVADFVKAPFQVRKYGSSFHQATMDVTTMSPEYMEYLRQGAGFMHNKVVAREFIDHFNQRLQNMEAGNPLWQATQAQLGLIGLPREFFKAWSSKSAHLMWASDDMMKMLSIREKMGAGKTLQEAIEDTNKHIPDYRVASRIFYASGKWTGAADRLMAQMFRNAGTVFGPYHYGVLKSYTWVMKDLLKATREKDPKNFAHNADVMFAVGFSAAVFYPFLNWVYQTSTGDKEARIFTPGAAKIPELLYRYGKAKVQTPSEKFSEGSKIGPFPDQSFRTPPTAGQILRGSISISPTNEKVLSLWMDRDFFYGNKPYTNAQAMIESVLSAYPPAGGALNILRGRATIKQEALREIGIDAPTEEQIQKKRKYYLEQLKQEQRGK